MRAVLYVKNPLWLTFSLFVRSVLIYFVSKNIQTWNFQLTRLRGPS